METEKSNTQKGRNNPIEEHSFDTYITIYTNQLSRMLTIPVHIWYTTAEVNRALSHAKMTPCLESKLIAPSEANYN